MINNQGVETKSNRLFIAFYEFFDALLAFIVAFLKKLFRGIRYFPYYIAGTNPYVFSKDSDINMSLYSRVQVHIFGWMSVVVVIYIFGASQKIATQLNLLGIDKEKYSFFYYIFSSIIFATIVFFFERFILSNPKIRKSAAHILWENVYRKKQSRWVQIPYLVFHYLKAIIKSISSLLLIFLRIILSLIIASLISATILFQINTYQISNNLKMIKEVTVNSFIQKKDDYKKYKSHVEKVRQKFFEKEALTICLGYARAGKLPDTQNLITNSHVNMEAAPRDSFSELQEEPTQLTCPVKNPNACQKEDFCPEVNDISERLTKADEDYNEAFANYERYGNNLENEKKHLMENTSIDDLSGQIQALALYYKDLYNENENKVNFWVNIGVTSPFLIILLLFELLPTIAKITFPHSSYDRLISDEELYYEFKSLALINIDAKVYFEKFSLLFQEDFDSLKKLRKIEYEKKQELSSTMEKVFDSLKDVLMEILNVEHLISLFSSRSISFKENPNKQIVLQVVIVMVGLIIFVLSLFVIYKSLMPYTSLLSLLKYIP